MDSVVSEVAQWTALIVAVSGSVITILRLWTKFNISNKNNQIEAQLTNELLINMRNEIERLNTRIGILENNINALRNLEIEGATDFGALEMVISHMPCTSCVNQGETFAQLSDVINRMKLRREERHNLIQNATEEGDN